MMTFLCQAMIPCFTSIKPPKGIILYGELELFDNKKQLMDTANSWNIPFARARSTNIGSRT